MLAPGGPNLEPLSLESERNCLGLGQLGYDGFRDRFGVM